MATAIDSANNVGTANIHIYMEDSTPPNVTITYPEDGYQTTFSTITVTGSIYDIVKGEVNEENASVSVNGVIASVSNKTFSAEIPLSEGENTITAVGADQTGNTDSAAIIVYREIVVDNKTITIVSGNNQSSPVNSQLSSSLVVALTNADGTPAMGETVIFEVVQNNGVLTRMS